MPKGSTNESPKGPKAKNVKAKKLTGAVNVDIDNNFLRLPKTKEQVKKKVIEYTNNFIESVLFKGPKFQREHSKKFMDAQGWFDNIHDN